jgi:hypothetical protein
MRRIHHGSLFGVFIKIGKPRPRMPDDDPRRGSPVELEAVEILFKKGYDEHARRLIDVWDLLWGMESRK